MTTREDRLRDDLETVITRRVGDRMVAIVVVDDIWPLVKAAAKGRR